MLPVGEIVHTEAQTMGAEAVPHDSVCESVTGEIVAGVLPVKATPNSALLRSHSGSIVAAMGGMTALAKLSKARIAAGHWSLEDGLWPPGNRLVRRRLEGRSELEVTSTIRLFGSRSRKSAAAVSRLRRCSF